MKRGRALRKFGAYFHALGKTGQLLTLLGLLPAVLDILSLILGLEFSIPSYISTLWFILTFAIANYRIFNANKEISLSIVKSDIQLQDWLQQYPGYSKSSLRTEITFQAYIQFEVRNPNPEQVFLKFSIPKIDSTGLLAKAEQLSKIELNVYKEGEEKPGLWNLKKSTITLGPKEIYPAVVLKAEFPLSVPNPDDGYYCLGSLSCIEVTVCAESVGNQEVEQTVIFDVKNIHDQIETELSGQLKTQAALEEFSSTLLKLRRYWIARKDKA